MFNIGILKHSWALADLSVMCVTGMSNAVSGKNANVFCMLVLGDIWEFQAAVSSGDSSAVQIFFLSMSIATSSPLSQSSSGLK